jgi:hypothetical protein
MNNSPKLHVTIDMMDGEAVPDGGLDEWFDDVLTNHDRYPLDHMCMFFQKSITVGCETMFNFLRLKYMQKKIDLCGTIVFLDHDDDKTPMLIEVDELGNLDWPHNMFAVATDTLQEIREISDG